MKLKSEFKRSNEETEALIINLKKEIENLRIHLKKNNISIPTLNNNQAEPTEEDAGQNYYSQYKELETKYKCLEVLIHLISLLYILYNK